MAHAGLDFSFLQCKNPRRTTLFQSSATRFNEWSIKVAPLIVSALRVCITLAIMNGVKDQ